MKVLYIILISVLASLSACSFKGNGIAASNYYANPDHEIRSKYKDDDFRLLGDFRSTKHFIHQVSVDGAKCRLGTSQSNEEYKLYVLNRNTRQIAAITYPSVDELLSVKPENIRIQQLNFKYHPVSLYALFAKDPEVEKVKGQRETWLLLTDWVNEDLDAYVVDFVYKGEHEVRSNYEVVKALHKRRVFTEFVLKLNSKQAIKYRFVKNHKGEWINWDYQDPLVQEFEQICYRTGDIDLNFDPDQYVDALDQGDLPAIKKFLKSDLSQNNLNIGLYAAALRCDRKMYQLFLQHGADLDYAFSGYSIESILREKKCAINAE